MAIGEKCNVEMINWNDGIRDSYIVNQDEEFLYYVTSDKKNKIVGALNKKYIDSIEICSKKGKNEEDFSKFINIQREYFVNKTTNMYFNDKYFFSGVIGEDTEMLNVSIIYFDKDIIRLMSGKEFEISQIVKIETMELG